MYYILNMKLFILDSSIHSTALSCSSCSASVQFCISYCHGSRDGSVSIAFREGAERLGFDSRQRPNRTHPASYPVATRGMKLTTHFRVLKRMVELYLHSPICPHGLVLNYIIECKDNFTFTFICDCRLKVPEPFFFLTFSITGRPIKL
jgi:hypothetical protein